MKIHRFYVTCLTAMVLVVSSLSYASAETLACNGRIAFATNRDGDYEIYTMEVDGSDVQQLTENDIGDGMPDWSPDGTKIAYISDAPSRTQVYVMNADGTERVNISANSSQNQFPAWSPDGEKIAFSRSGVVGSQIFVMNADGSNQRNITNLDDNSTNIAPEWSADGAKILFASDRTMETFCVGCFWFNFYIMNTDGSNQVRLVDGGLDVIVSSWSPDGTQILFHQSYLSKEIMRVNADGSNLKFLTEDMSDDTNPAWSPDGQRIVFIHNGNIAIMPASGGDITVITSEIGQIRDPDWQPLDCDVE